MPILYSALGLLVLALIGGFVFLGFSEPPVTQSEIVIEVDSEALHS